MDCPNCGKVLDFIAPVFRNLENFGGSCLGTTTCCGTAFKVSIIYKFDIKQYEGEKEKDDWGNKIDKK